MNKNKIIEIVKRIPNLIESLDNDTITALMALHKNNKVIVFQYQNKTTDISDTDLLDAMQRSIQYYRTSTVRLLIITPDADVPQEDERMKCFECTLADAIKQKVITMDSIKQSRAYNDGIHFIACAYVSDKNQFSMHFFKPLS